MKLLRSFLAGASMLAVTSIHAATFTVTTIDDSGPGSLRQAILDANAAAGDDTIAFATNGTITLLSALPPITDSLTIAGPGTNLLTISGNNAVQVFSLSAGTTNTISGVTIANGLATGYANGGGIANAGTLALLNCTLLSNSNLYGWGGAVFNSGNMAASNSAFVGNQVVGEKGYASTNTGGGGGAAMGGAIFTMSGNVVLATCLFSDNAVLGGTGGGHICCCTNCTGRGGGVNGGNGSEYSLWDGYPGGFGGGGGGGASAGGDGGFGGGGGGNGGSPGFAGGRGNELYNYGPDRLGGEGGGGGGLGSAVFVHSGTTEIAGCSFRGNVAEGGYGYYDVQSGWYNPGIGLVGSVFNWAGAVGIIQNSVVNVLNTNTAFETWEPWGPNYALWAPVGVPLVYADGQFTLSNLVKFSSTTIGLSSSFTGAIVYSLDGSDPHIHATLYSGPFTVGSSALLRAVAYDSSFTASAEIDPIQITILPTLATTTAGGGFVNVEPLTGPYFLNPVAQVTAQPASSGWTFLQWLGDANGTNPTALITMNRNKYVEAVFGTSLGTVVVGSGSLLVDPALPLYPFGTVVKLTAEPQSGSYFAQWGAAASGTNNPLTFVISNANPNVAAVFSTLSADGYTLTTIESGRGHVSTNPQLNYYTNGQPVTLTAIPDAGQSFLGWSGDASGTANPLSLTMTNNKVVTASFSRRPRLEVGTPLEGLVEDGFRLTLLGEFGTVYDIPASTNLSDWTVAGTVTNTYGAVQFTDPQGTNLLYRFYGANAH